MAEQTRTTPQQDVPQYVTVGDLVQAADDILAQVAEKTDDDDQLERVRRARQQLFAARDDTDDDEIATDGGVAVDTADDDRDVWSRPLVETDRHGEPTGFEFVRCLDCGAEVLEQHRDDATHKPGCRHR